MRARVLAGALIALAASAGGQAKACFWVGVTEFGDKPSQAELIAREKRASAEQIRKGARKAKRDLAAGVDPAAALAQWTVPNIRPVPTQRSDCGPVNEIDLGEDEEGWEDWLAGTPYAGRAEEFGRVLDVYRGPTLGRTCNAEVRDRFAAHLRRRLTPARMAEVYVFLAARRRDDSVVERMTFFEGRRGALRSCGRAATGCRPFRSAAGFAATPRDGP